MVESETKASKVDLPRNVRWEIARLSQLKPVKTGSIAFKENDDGSAIIKFDIETDILLDPVPKSIRDVEPIVFKYELKHFIGIQAPAVLSGRENFPRNLSHLNPVPADEPVSLCLARAGLQAIYDVGGVDGTIRRLLNWLNDAKTETLYEDGWDPVPPMGMAESVLGYLDAEALQQHASGNPEGGYGYIKATICHGNNDEVFVHAEYALLNTDDPQQINDAKNAMAAYNAAGHPFHTAIPAIFCWPPRDCVESNPRYANWRNMESFIQGLRDTKLYDVLDEAFLKLDPLFGEKQDTDKRKHRTVIVIVGLWRPAPLDPTIVGLTETDDARHLELSEPPRDCRRLQLLRGWSHDKENNGKIFT